MTALRAFPSAEHLKFAELQVAVETQAHALFSQDKITFRKEAATRFPVTRMDGRSSSLSVELGDDLRTIRFKIDDTNMSHFGMGKTDEGEICLFYGTKTISVAEAVDELLASFLLNGFFKSRPLKTLRDR
jgi:hypothetical protein